jgi:hypothetical protein
MTTAKLWSAIEGRELSRIIELLTIAAEELRADNDAAELPPNPFATNSRERDQHRMIIAIARELEK